MINCLFAHAGVVHIMGVSTDRDHRGRIATKGESMALKKTRTACTTCHSRCGAIVYSEDGRIVRITGDRENPFSHGAFCGSGLSQREIHNNPEDRIVYPMKRAGRRGEGTWERISWDEALTTMVEKQNEILENYGPESIVVGQGTGRTTNHWHNRLDSSLGLEGWSLTPTHVCLMPQIIPNALTLGVFGTTADDIANANTIVLWGISTTSLYGSIKLILDRKEAGTKILVIDVRYTDFASMADLYLRPRPGTDGALALGLMHVLIENGSYDPAWIESWTYGFDELKDRVAEWTPEKTAEVCWITPEEVVEAAEMLADNGPVAFEVMLGAGCMHTNAIQNGRAIACLQGLLGYIDVKGGVPINTAFSVMLDDRITLWDPDKDPGRPELFTFGGEKHPLYKAMARSNDPYSTFEAAITGEPRPVKMMVFIASDALLSYENTQHTYKALTSDLVDLIVVKDFYLSPTAKLADIVLPSSDWSERDTIDEENFGGGLIISTERAVDPPGECWDDWRFFLEWGKRTKPEDWPWKDEREMVLWRLREFYDMDLTWDEYVDGAYFRTQGEPVYKKYEKGMLRPDGSPGFPTTTGRIEFYCSTLASFGYDPVPDYTEPAMSPYSTPEIYREYPLVLTTGFRVYSFFHSAWTNIPAQRSLYPYPFSLINPEDARALDISEGEWVTVESPHGKVRLKAHVTNEIGKGVVAVPRAGWRDACPELGLPGYGWDKANPNMLVPSEPAEPGFGSTPMRSLLCRVVKGEN